MMNMKEYQGKHKWIVAIICMILMFSNFPVFAYADQLESLNLPLKEIMNGSEQLEFSYHGTTADGEPVLISKSTEELNSDFKLKMPAEGSDGGYVLAIQTPKNNTFDSIIDPFSDDDNPAITIGGTYENGEWNITATELLKLVPQYDSNNQPCGNDYFIITKTLGESYFNPENTYYGIYIISYSEDIPSFYLFIEVGSGKETVAAPTASPEAGTYSTPIDVTLTSATEDAKIYYTLDGIQPTTASTLYGNTPIHIAKDTTLRAIAVKEGSADSSELRAEYKFETAAAPPSLVEGVYQIENAAQLVGLQDIVIEKQDDTQTRESIKVKLLNDIQMQNVYSRKDASSFYGEFDGNGYTITVGDTYTRLFGTNYGTIRNLTIQGSLNSVSALCDQNNGTIENCHNAANLSNAKSKEVGALCGINEASGIIRNCYNTGKLSGIYVGGICGQNWGLIENCFNAGLIDAEKEAGGIAWRNHNNVDNKDTLNAKSGTIRNCYNFNVMHHTMGWGGLYGSYIENNLGPICGDNEKKTINVQDGTNKIANEGKIENGWYLDTVVSNKPNGRPLSVALSDIYLAQKKDFESFGAGTYSGTAIAGWTEKDASNSIFAYNTDYYVFYDNSNGHFIAVTFDSAETSAVIDAAKPSEQSEICKSAAGDEKAFYLVKVPTGTTSVQFNNTDAIIDYANGYTNRYLKAYLQLDHHGTTSGKEYSRKFVGTAITFSDVDTILNAVGDICGSDTETVAFVKEMLSGIETQRSTTTPTESEIKVRFRLVGATKSTSGNYDAKTNKDSQYVTWLATRTYTLKDGSTVGDLLQLAIKESGMKTVGENNNYVSGIYAPNILGNYYLAEFTNGPRSGWMYSVNGTHPSVGLNGYYLKDGDSVIWHYVNDYSYEVSDWFDDPGYPNLGDASTWDPWLKVADVDPTKDTPTVGGANEETVKDVTTTGSSGSATTTAPTDVKVSEKTNADGTKETVAEVKVDKAHHDEIIKQATENKSVEIVLEVEKTDTKGADSVQLSLDVSFVKNVSEKTDADLTVNTENGKVTLDQETIKTVLTEAKSTTITLEVTKVSNPTDVQQKAAGESGHIIKLVVKSGNQIISDFNKGKATVTVEIPAKLLDKKLAAIHIADDGKIEQLPGKTVKIDGKDYYIFETPHFSVFALVDADELGLEVNDEEANIVKIKELISDMSLKARSSKTSKKNIKVTLTVDKSTAAAIKEIKDMGYTVKYKYYRSTKKASKYQAKITKTTKSFTNTAGKKGTRYYYKARIQVYDKDGKLVAQTALKQCKYAARTWTK